MKYTKPPLCIADQLRLSESRGMTIDDYDRATRYLSHISYFRLRGYWIPFEKKGDGKNHHFKDGTTFQNVLDLYLFDRKFRILILEAIERLEVSFRANFANSLGVRYGSHFYLKNKYINDVTIHSRLVKNLELEINRSSELFIKHYCKTYDDPPLPPIWAAAEIMSFGQLSLWFKNLKHRSDRNLVAKAYNIDEKVLKSFMHHLTFIRNITAHHGRLWNRRMTITVKQPKNPKDLRNMLNPEGERYIGNTVIMLGYFLRMISPGTSWPSRIYYLIDNSPGILPFAMGFKKNWKSLPLWDGQKLKR